MMEHEGWFWVFGATGYVGQAVVRNLAERGLPVVAHVRPDSARLVEWRNRFAALGANVQSDTTPFDVAALSLPLREKAPRAIIICIGTTKARQRDAGEKADYSYDAIDYGLTATIAKAAAACELRPRLVYLSALGADASSPLPYLKARGRAEAAVAASGLPYAYLRPAIISGPDREEKRIGEAVGRVIMDGALNGLGRLGAGFLQRRYASANAAQLAEMLATLALEPLSRDRAVEIGELR